MAEYKAKLKTAEKLEKDLKDKLSKNLEGDFVTKVKCVLCTKHVDSIKHHKNFTQKRLSKKLHSKIFQQGSTQKSQQTRAKKKTRCHEV